MMSTSRSACLAAVLLTLVFVVSGCASLPDTSTPEAIGTIGQEPAEQTAPPPAPGAEPSLLLRKFFEASTDPTDRHATARQYLTGERARTWDDAASTVIVDKVDFLIESRDDDVANYTVRTNRVGELQSGGNYEAQEGSFEFKVRFDRVDGEWRIADIPDGVMLDRPLFFKSYKNVALYFLDPSGTTTVPDLRWIPSRQDQVAAQLIGLLLGGPKPALVPAVRTQLGENVSLIGQITKADGRTSSVGVGPGGVRIDLQGVSELDSTNRVLLASQVIWSLANAEISGPYVLLADGKPLDDRYANGWTTADVADLNPLSKSGSDVGLHALRDGSLVAVRDTGVVATPGYFGSVRNVRSIALSNDGTLVAAVVDTGRPAPEPTNALRVGTYDGGAFPVAEGGTISRPSWAPRDGSAWAVVDGVRVTRAVRDRQTSQVSVVDVEADAVTSLGRISELRLSRDGVRAAMIIDGKVYFAVVVALPNGNYSLTSPRLVPIGAGSTATSLDWSSGENVVIARASSDVPVVLVTVDGARLEMLPNRNLTAPVVAVDATPTTEYVADSRSVFQLNNTDPPAERYWREVPGLSGIKAIPVLPG